MILHRSCFFRFRSQEANERYTVKFITALFEEEAKGVFITRENVLGHLQQVFSCLIFLQILQPFSNFDSNKEK